MGKFFTRGDILFFDLHSHILPGVDDGAENIKESLKLLKMMKQDGITDVIATSHFYPMEMSFEEYVSLTKNTYNKLCNKIKGKGLPNLYLGCELLNYRGVGNSEFLDSFCLNHSKYLLLELTDFDLNKSCMEDILTLKENGITPIIAHVERYFKGKNYKKFLQFVEDNKIPVQINAASVMMWPYRFIVKRILAKDIFCVIATDTHSAEERPPLMTPAFAFIEKKYGVDTKNRLIANAQTLKKEIIGEKDEK